MSRTLPGHPMDHAERALRTLSAGNRTLVRATDEPQLLHDMCRVIVEVGAYRGACVAYADQDEARTLRIVAFYGPAELPPALPYVTWADNADGQTTAAIAIRTGRPAVGRQLLSDPSLAPHWRDEAVRFGYASVSSFPLLVDGRAIGNLTVFSAEPDAFDDAEVELLAELAEDLAFGIKTVRVRLERARAEVQRQRAERASRTLSECNRTQLRATDEARLLQDMCRVIVKVGGYRAAAIVYAEHDPEKTLRPMAGVGWEGGSSGFPKLTWADSEIGNTAAGIAVRTGQPCIGMNLLADAAVAPVWREQAQRRGYAAHSAFPLVVEGQVIGCLAIFAQEPDAFDAEEAALLGELASDLSFGITTLRLRQRHQQAEQTIRHMALHDAVTGLPNRTRLNTLLSDAITAARSANLSLALLVLDIARFREVNEVIGYARGDELLRALGRRLGDAVGPAGTLAHLGRDEFAVLLSRADMDLATETAQRLLKVLDEPFEISGIRVEVSAHIGISLFPGHGKLPELLILRADAAMDQAKREHRGHALYRGIAEAENQRREALIGDLRRGIEGKQLLLYCQPKVDMRKGVLAGAEALVRWQHPELGLVPPDRFIPLAERTGLIQPLTRWVLNAALGQCYAWNEQGLVTPLAVNFSVHNLRDPRLPGRIHGLLATWGAPAEWLHVEVTESSLMEDPAGTLEILKRLKGMGITLSIDDFGTGYSSLSYLQKLPIDAIKIDKSFVLELPDDKDSQVIVRSTIDMAHDLGLKVVAEGVETQEIWDRLVAMDCDVAQGNFVSVPLPAEAFFAWQAQSRWQGR
jgi:diguanylate cyclase